MRVQVGADALWAGDSGGGGVPLVLLHPGIADSTVWDALLPALGEQRVIRFDQRGFGGTPISTEAFRGLDDLLAVLDRLEVGSAHLVGNSMGGGLALALAVTAPERAASLTLLCPAAAGYPWPDPTPQQQAEMEEFRGYFAAGDVDGLVRMGAAEWCAQGTDDYLLAQLAASFRADLAHAELEQDGPEVWQSLPDLDLPTAMVLGEQDPVSSRELSAALADRIPGAELVRLDVDHLPQYRDPAAVADVVRRTVARAG